MTSPIINIPLQSGTFVTIDETTLKHRNHPNSIVYFMVHSWCSVVYGFGQIYNDMDLSLLYPSIFTALNSSVLCLWTNQLRNECVILQWYNSFSCLTIMCLLRIWNVLPLAWTSPVIQMLAGYNCFNILISTAVLTLSKLNLSSAPAESCSSL